jgi:putative membrane protein
MPTLTEADAKRIEAAVAIFEAKTSAEFVVAVVPESARYSRGRAAVALTWAMAGALVYFHFVPWGGAVTGVALELPIAALVWLLFGITPFRRLLVPAAHADQAVRRTALRLFAERGIHRTRDATGILLLLSELERRAVLLGDRGVHDLVGDAGWDAHMAHLVARMRAGKTTDGVLEIMERIGAVLESRAPRAADDTDELPNRVVRER